MTRPRRLRKLLLTPLVYLAALILLFEEWCWDTGVAIARWLAARLPLDGLDERIRRLPPYAALALFVLPAILLFPVKIMALMAIASGHVFTGVCTIVLAKIGGAAAVARLYLLTRPTLLTVKWFARWHDAFIALKDRWIGRLKATAAWRRTRMLGHRIRSAARALKDNITARPGGRLSIRPARYMRRIMAMWRARRRSWKER